MNFKIRCFGEFSKMYLIQSLKYFYPEQNNKINHIMKQILCDSDITIKNDVISYNTENNNNIFVIYSDQFNKIVDILKHCENILLIEIKDIYDSRYINNSIKTINLLVFNCYYIKYNNLYYYIKSEEKDIFFKNNTIIDVISYIRMIKLKQLL